MQTAEHIIRKRCGPADIYSRTDDNGFTICFSETNEVDASFRAAAIGREIRFRVIGDGENADAMQVSAVAARVALPPEEPGQSATLADQRRQEALTSQLTAIEGETQVANGRSASGDGCGIETVWARKDAAVLGWYVNLPVRGAAGVAPQAARPMLEFAAKQGGEELVFVDVAFELFLVRSTAEAYLTQCRGLPPKMQRRLVLMLSGLPEGVPHSRVLDITQRLRPLCRSVGYVIDDLEFPPVDMELVKGTLLSVDAARWDGGSLLPEARLSRLLAALHAYRGRLLMRHVSNQSMARHVRGLGVDWVSVVDAG
jgi:hypothetical protein